jgi:hypothetical protein
MFYRHRQTSALLGLSILLLSCALYVLFFERHYLLAVFLLLLDLLVVYLALSLMGWLESSAHCEQNWHEYYPPQLSPNSCRSTCTSIEYDAFSDDYAEEEHFYLTRANGKDIVADVRVGNGGLLIRAGRASH